ncbi:hypothetical protein [uncultured Pseudodesulfovibrio sp.]|uniref:hypothetical protein n=1 Tax=uncultured Pseudodesulfovibrio sp. TaxID=2035858 RepID=UPI0029C7418E|nr:hypothetical protein [uncultured Pseudodesulfovibrio sp.]
MKRLLIILIVFSLFGCNAMYTPEADNFALSGTALEIGSIDNPHCNFERAKNILMSQIKEDPNYVLAHTCLCILYLQRNMLNEAKDSATSAYDLTVSEKYTSRNKYNAAGHLQKVKQCKVALDMVNRRLAKQKKDGLGREI